MASKPALQKQQVAMQLGYGMSLEDVARVHKLTAYGLHRLLDDPAVQRMKEAYEEEFKIRTVARTIELEGLWPEALKSIQAAIDGKLGTQRDQIDSSWKLVETLMPSKKQQVDIDAQLAVAPETVTQLMDAIQGATDLLRQRDGSYRLEEDPHLLPAPDTSRKPPDPAPPSAPERDPPR